MRRFLFACTITFALWGLATPAQFAAAQAGPEQCDTCDELNARPGAGGPGFSDWQFWCTPNGGEVTARVGTRGQPGVWTAGFGLVGQVATKQFEGSTYVVVSGVRNGSTIVRWLQRPDGTYAIAPKEEVFLCGDCEQPSPPSTTSPPVTPPTTVPVTSIPGTSTTPPPVVSSVPGTTTTVPWDLPATGTDPAGVAFVACIIGGVGAFLLFSRRYGDGR